MYSLKCEWKTVSLVLKVFWYRIFGNFSNPCSAEIKCKRDRCIQWTMQFTYQTIYCNRSCPLVADVTSAALPPQLLRSYSLLTSEPCLPIPEIVKKYKNKYYRVNAHLHILFISMRLKLHSRIFPQIWLLLSSGEGPGTGECQSALSIVWTVNCLMQKYLGNIYITSG